MVGIFNDYYGCDGNTPQQEVLVVFLKQLEKLLKDDYGMVIADTGLVEEDMLEALESGETPQELVDWIAQKYNLTHCSE